MEKLILIKKGVLYSNNYSG